jgi:Putative prokaryotic signal transducing protein
MTERDVNMTILMQTTDAPRAHVVHSLLEASGVRVMKSELAPGLIGWMPQFVLHVAAADLERAHALIAAMDAETPVDEDDEGDDEAPDLQARNEAPSAVDYRSAARGAPQERVLAPRLKRIAAFCAFALPLGGGHMYVHRYRTALMIAGLQVISFLAARAGIPYAGLGMLLMIAADLAGSTWECDDQARGAAAPHRWRRLAVSVAAIAVLGWLPIGGGPALSWIAGEDGRALCEHRSRCLDLDYGECVARVALQRSEGRPPYDGCAECLAELPICGEDIRRECPSCFRADL